MAGLLMPTLLLSGCGKSYEVEGTASIAKEASELTEQEKKEITEKKYVGDYSEKDGSYSGVDSLGRVLSEDVEVEPLENDKTRTTGVFYFLWQGQHGTDGPYDNSVIEKVPGATESEENWIAAGGGPEAAHHFWGQPLFGYYTSDDTWVMRKHVQMLTDAGVDYLVFDTTNAITYSEQALKLLAILDEYRSQGYNAPQISFYTNAGSGDTINRIYDEVYKAHPEYERNWFRWDGKPLIIGIPEEETLRDECKEFFRIKHSQWPIDSIVYPDGFPWMEFYRAFSDDAVYGQNGEKEVLSVSMAQHASTCTMSLTAWYGAGDRTRSYHDGENDTSEEALLSGANFKEQLDWALEQDVQSMFITGWNEWVAQRQPARPMFPIVFVDCANENTSRDAEPSAGKLGDNYYMQMMDGIRRFKGTQKRVDVGEFKTIDLSGEMSQFDDVTAVYTDYKNDTVDRDATGFGDIKYEDKSGLNDIVETRVVRDQDNIFFRVTTNDKIKKLADKGRMSLFLKVGENGCEKIGGYDYVINRDGKNGANLTLEHWNGNAWETVGSIAYKLKDNMMMLAVPRALIDVAGCTDAEYDLVDLQFKWADGYDEEDVFSFYTKGDAAPYGRLNYLFSNVK